MVLEFLCGLTTRSKNATNGAPGIATSSFAVTKVRQEIEGRSQYKGDCAGERIRRLCRLPSNWISLGALLKGFRRSMQIPNCAELNLVASLLLVVTPGILSFYRAHPTIHLSGQQVNAF